MLAFPCNQFGGQEPGTNDEILEFATSQAHRLTRENLGTLSRACVSSDVAGEILMIGLPPDPQDAQAVADPADASDCSCGCCSACTAH